MNCPFCKSDSKVVKTREGFEGIRRSHKCVACGRMFTTYERLHVLSSMVRKEDGSLEAYSPDKLRRGIKLACTKRSVAYELVASRVEHRLYSMLGNREHIRARRIGELTMDELRAVDRVAYIRYASVYRNFTDTDDFIAEVDSLKRRNSISTDQMKLFEDTGEEASLQPSNGSEQGNKQTVKV